MAERLAKMFSSPKFKENRTYISNNLSRNNSPLLTSSRYNTMQDELSLEMDAKSEGFTSRICDTANKLLLGEFPWGSDNQGYNSIDSPTISHKRLPKPVPVRLRIGPPNSNTSILLAETDSEFDNDECNNSKSLIQALREMSRKRTHSLMNDALDEDLDSSGAVAKRSCKPEYRHNLYLSQLEEETQEYKNNLSSQTDEHLERSKRGREDDSGLIFSSGSTQDILQNKRPRRNVIINGNQIHLTPEEHSTNITCNNTNDNANTKSILHQSNRTPRRGSNEILSSLSSSLTLLDPAVLHNLIKPLPIAKERRKKRRQSVVAVETQTMEQIVEESEKNDQGTPKKEDKSINTEPEKIERVPVKEKVVTDKMANALMKSAVSKFLATEDPTLSPVTSPLPSANNSINDKILSPANELKTTTASISLQVSTPTTVTFPSISNEKPLNNSFTFGLPLTTTANLTISNSTITTKTVTPFSFGSPVSSSDSSTTANVITSTTSSLLFTTNNVTTQAVTNTNSKPTSSLGQISFGDNKLPSFQTVQNNKDDKGKNETVLPTNLFNQPPVTTASTLVTSTASELGKGTFSFGFSTPSTTSVTEISKTSPFAFGTANTNLNKFPTTSSIDSTNKNTTTFGLATIDGAKPSLEPSKLSLFSTNPVTTTSTTTPKSIEPIQMGTSSFSTPSTASTFQFGGTNSGEQKSDKPDDKKPQGLFNFGASNLTPTTKTEAKPLQFGTSISSTTTQPQPQPQPQQQPKQIFPFGASSSFSTPQANKDTFNFGAKTTSEQTTSPGFNSPVASSMFGSKPTIPSTSTNSTTTSVTTASGIFGFGSVQSMTTTAPTFGSTSSNPVGGFNFQPNKPEEKPANGGFPFKFPGNTTSSSDPPKPNFTFGSTVQATSPPPVFGASAMPTQPTFGSVTQPTPNFPTFPNTPAPAFGTNPTSPASNLPFGTTTPVQPTFGTPAPVQPTPVFGSMQTPQSSTGFNFGSSTAANSTSGFNFVPPGQPTAQPPAPSGVFQFGSSTAQQNPGGPFQFNAGPSSTPQGIGFTSPVSGFNPGVGGAPMFSIGSGSTAARSKQNHRRNKKL